MGLTVARYWEITDSMVRPRFCTSRLMRRHSRTSASASTKMRMSICSHRALFSKIKMPSTTMTRVGSTSSTSRLRLWTV